MTRTIAIVGASLLLLVSIAGAATEETKQATIDRGLEWLAATQVDAGSEGYWPFANNGTLAATGTAVLAFVEEGYLPGDGSTYDGVVTRALNYIFARATVDPRFGVEHAVYTRYAEDYDDDGVYDDGNDEAIYFEPGATARRVYTTGIIVPVVYALGEALGRDSVVGFGSPAIANKTWAQALQDLVDWFAWGQVEPDRGVHRGGWRYDANYGNSDNSTAQWGSLPLLYAADWGLGVAPFVFAELELWIDYIQNPNGGSGYDSPTHYVNMSKTGGLLLELAAIGAPATDARVVAARNFIDARWNNGPSSTWYGNLDHPYAMWAVYKGLQVYGHLIDFDCGDAAIPIGIDIPSAPGGFPICFDAAPATSQPGDWYSHYCDFLAGNQNADGSWTGYSYWTGALATGWYINILNATPVPPVCDPFEVLIGESWDGIPLQDVLDAEYGVGTIDAENDYEGALCGDAEIPYWFDDSVDGWIVREIADSAHRNTMGWYAEDFSMPAIDGVDDGVIITGGDGEGDPIFVGLPGPTRFGLYLNPNGDGDAFNAPEPELFFTNRNYNDIGPDGSGALHEPDGGDPQALVYDVSHLNQGVPTYVVAWEDLDYGAEMSPVYVPNLTDNDFNDLVVEIRASSPVAATVARITTTAQRDGVEVGWDVTNVAHLDRVVVQRRGEAGFVPIARVERPRASGSLVDTSLPGAGDFTYRIVATAHGIDVLSREATAFFRPATVDRTTLVRAVPNPFNPTTRIEFALERPGPVRMEIHDLSGRRVRSIDLGERPGGLGSVEWNGRDDDGRNVASGVYHVSLVADARRSALRVVLLK